MIPIHDRNCTAHCYNVEQSGRVREGQTGEIIIAYICYLFWTKEGSSTRYRLYPTCRIYLKRCLFWLLGMWYSILEFLNVAGVVTNSFLVAFTSSYGRSWEGDILTTNRTETVFNNVTNTSETIFIITEHIPAASRLWLIIAFEVSRCFVLSVNFSVDWSAITDKVTLVGCATKKKSLHF